MAVLDGDWVPEDQIEAVPEDRWSYHPGGYYLRYLPHSYQDTVLEVYVPAAYTVTRDDKGRITDLARADGSWSVHTDYDDRVAPKPAPGGPTLVACAFEKTTLHAVDPQTGEPHEDAVSGGWTFVRQEGQVGLLDKTPSSRSPVCKVGDDFDPSDPFGDMPERYEQATGYYDTCAYWKERANQFEHGGSIDDIEDLGHYKDGIEAATSGTPSDRAGWMANHMAAIANAWMWVHCQLTGECNGKGADMDPSDGLAMPGNASAQRLASTGRGIDW